MSSLLPPDDWLVDLFESDVFGEEAMLDGCIGSSRLTTAAASANSSSNDDVELLYLTRLQYDAISAPHMQIGGYHERLQRSGATDMDVYSRQLLGVGKQAMYVTAMLSFAVASWPLMTDRVLLLCITARAAIDGALRSRA